MSYQIELSAIALKGIQKLKATGEIATIEKLNLLLNELREHPETGTGKPERLKFNYSGKWSRRISDKHRLIYEIRNEIVTVVVFSTFGHYED